MTWVILNTCAGVDPEGGRGAGGGGGGGAPRSHLKTKQKKRSPIAGEVHVDFMQ